MQGPKPPTVVNVDQETEKRKEIIRQISKDFKSGELAEGKKICVKTIDQDGKENVFFDGKIIMKGGNFFVVEFYKNGIKYNIEINYIGQNFTHIASVHKGIQRYPGQILIFSMHRFKEGSDTESELISHEFPINYQGSAESDRVSYYELMD